MSPPYGTRFPGKDGDVDAGKVIGIIRAPRTGPVVSSVQRSDREELIHASRVEFHIE
jgi:hypothetical protein